MPRRKKQEEPEVDQLELDGTDEDSDMVEEGFDDLDVEGESEQPAVRATAVQRVVDAEAANDAREAFDWLSSLGASATKVTLHRRHPRIHKGFPCSGLIDSWDYTVSLEEIRERHGGGKFQIIVYGLNPNHGKPGKGKQPRIVYVGARNFEIAGFPKLENLEGYTEKEQGSSRGGGGGESSRAMDLAETLVKEANARAFRAESSQRPDTDMIAALTERHEKQIETMQTMLQGANMKIVDLLSQKPDTSKEDRLIDLVGNKEKAHADYIANLHKDFATQLAAVRAAHESEIRQVREFSRNELERHQDRFDRQLDQIEKTHEREIVSMQHQHESGLTTLKLSYDTRIDSLNQAIRTLESERGELRSELAALRARKDVGPAEQLQGLVAIKHGFDALMPPKDESGDEDKPVGGIRGIIDTVVNSDLAKVAAARVMAGVSAPPAPPPEPTIPVRRKDGAIVQVPRSVVARAQAQAKARAQQVASGAAPEVQLNPREVSVAVQFIEAAYRNQTPPEVLAASARNMVPAAILGYLKTHGVDQFLNNVAGLQDGSPLATVDGRMYIRKVAKFLLEGSLEGLAEEATPDAQPGIDNEAEIGDPSVEGVEDLPDAIPED